MRNSARDTASVHVLEAVVVASIMISAVAFVVTFESVTPSSIGAAREGLEVKANDILAIMYDTPAVGNTSRFGDDVLSAAIALCLNQNCTALSENLTRLAPRGASYALYVSNGHETYPVLVQGSPAGESVSATRSFEPRWSSTFLATATESVTPDDALLTYALPVFYANPVTPDGSQLFVKVIGKRADGSDYVLIASYATVARGENEPDAVGASLYFVSHEDEPLPVLDLSGHLAEARQVRLRLDESEGGDIPDGAEVTVHVPRGWTASAPVADNPDWIVLANADDKNGSYVGSAVRAKLAQSLSDDHADLTLEVVYHGDVLDYYPFVATLSRGATAVASMLVRGEQHATEPAIATPELVMSVPNPMGSGAPTVWTLSTYIPAGDDTLPGGLSGEVTVERIEITEQDSNLIFGRVTTVEGPADSTWTSGGTSIVWEGEIKLNYEQALNLSFLVEASGIAGPGDARSQFVPPVSFDTWTGRIVERSGWGFYRQAVLPADSSYSGYNSTTSGVGVQHPLTTEAVYRSTQLPGSITYNVSALGSVQDSLYGSYVTAESHSVPVGGEVVINANVQSLLFALTEAGQSAGVTLRFYPPWSGDERIPIYEQENLDQGLLSGEVSQLVLLDINGDGHLDPVIGTTNGRVIAYHGKTGQRLQGNTWIAPLTRAAEEEQAVPRINVMSTIQIEGVDYIVVGTDKHSDGLFVLAKNFTVRWKYVFDTADTLALDTSVDFNGDNKPEIVAVRTYDVGLDKYAMTYLFEADPNVAWGGLLDAIRAAVVPDPENPDALFVSLGTPNTVLAQERAGPFGDRNGILVPIQTPLEPGFAIDDSTVPPTVAQENAALPRAGVQGLNDLGETTSTLFGSPASVLRDYDFGGDAVDDALLGGASGYVTLANGTALTQPLYSYVVSDAPMIISADTLTSAESYVLTSNGQVRFTDDAWSTGYLFGVLAVGGSAIAASESNDVWVVGSANQIWHSVPIDLGEDPSQAHYMALKDLAPYTYTAERNGADYSLVLHLHDLTDIWFRGETGYVVGAPCAILVECGEPMLLRTLDGGTSWDVLTYLDDSLVGTDGESEVTGTLRRVAVFSDGTGWAVGDAGLVLRKSAGSEVWQQVEAPFSTTYDLLDVSCAPNALDDCIFVGETGAAFRASDARTTPSWTNLTPSSGLPGDRDLYSVGFANDTTIYVGSQNMVLASYDGSTFTALPLNYLENDGRVVSTPGDNGLTGYVYGGSAANGRIWLLHDYHVQSQAVTNSYAARFPGDAEITRVTIANGNVTFADETTVVNVTTDGGTTWKTLGALVRHASDARRPAAASVDFASGTRDLQFLISFNTSGASTIHSPQIRALSFDVVYNSGGSTLTTTIPIDLTTRAEVNDALTTADWNDSEGTLHQGFVREYWTRNVTGEVYDIQTGYDVVGDDRHDVWVATGNVLSENSPDYVIYAGLNTSKIMGSHNRVYLLDGETGDPAAISDWLDGEVRQIRLGNEDGVGGPDVLFAATWNSSTEVTVPPTIPYGRLYALDPVTLDERWSILLGRQMPVDMETTRVPGDHAIAFLGTQRPTQAPEELGQLWAVNGTDMDDEWAIVPDDLGKYIISTTVQPGWLFGPYVVEIEVEWEQTVVDELAVAQTVLRSARFYDHFMVTPPDLVSPPTPVYTARLLMWMQDWA